MNFLCKLFGGSYDDLWKAIIRPGRDIYEEQELGPFKFEINGKCYKRTDFELINDRGLKLICSFWEPFDEERERVNLPCVIYLHGNSSSRCEAYAEVKYLLPKNICLFSFDFCGCGKSEGDYISLGYYEKEDVQCVIEYLLKSKKVSKIGLWGRSMGAVTAIMYTAEHPNNISALILDSGFYSLNILIHELVKSKINLPNFIIERVLKMVKQTIKEKAGFDLDEIEPYLYVKNCKVPAFFCHGRDDNFVFPHHCKDLYKDYKGDYKYLNLVRGNHNSSRPKEIKNKASKFLADFLKDDALNNDETIINCNSYHKIIFNNNEILFNDDNDNNNFNYNNYSNNMKKVKCRQRYKSKDKIINTIKYNLNNYINRESTDEHNIMNNNNACKNMRAYSHNKYSKNDLKIINKNNTNNCINKININMININKNRFEDNDSSSSSSIIEEPSIYTKKTIYKETPIINNIVRSVSVKNSEDNKRKAKIHCSPKKNHKTHNKSLNKRSINNVKMTKTQNSTKNDLTAQSINYMNNVIKDNNFLQTDKNNSKAVKTFTINFFNKYTNNNNNYNNYNKINTFFSVNNNNYFNNHKEIESRNKKNEDKINFNFCASKRPSDKDSSLFRKRTQKIENKLINININLNNEKKDLSLISKKLSPREEKKTITTENTILDENEEIIGRNLPH